MRLNEIVEYLGLNKPFEIKIISKGHKHCSADYSALYKDGGNGKLHKHVIRVFAGNLDNTGERNLETLIAHELIHAWQEEFEYPDTHGHSFQMMAANIECEFGIKDIYRPEIDI